MDVRVGLQRRLSTEELMLLNCGVGEDSWESLGLQGDPTSSFWRRQLWDFFGRNHAKAETPVLWPPHAKSWLIGKDSDAGRDWGQEEKGMTEDEMAGWHHRLNGREFEWTPGVGDGQGGLACCDSWGRRVGHDWETELNWTESESEVARWCPTLCNPMHCSPPGSSVHGIFQAKILEWVVTFFSSRSSQPRDWTRVSRIVGRRFTIWTTREVLSSRVIVFNFVLGKNK